jgi:hypothetical protein
MIAITSENRKKEGHLFILAGNKNVPSFTTQHHTFLSCDIPTLIKNSKWEINQLPLTGDVDHGNSRAQCRLHSENASNRSSLVTFEDDDGWDI